jgi:hypothetical protein
MISHVLYRFRAKPTFMGWYQSFKTQFDELEACFVDILIGRCIDYAAGAQLDLLGAVVGETRGSWAEEAFRARIKLRIFINRSNGLFTDVLTVLRLLFATAAAGVQPKGAFQLHENTVGPGFEVFFTGEYNPAVHPALSDITDRLREVRAAGYPVDFLYSAVGVAGSLLFCADDLEGAYRPANSFSGGDESAGGVFAEIEVV